MKLCYHIAGRAYRGHMAPEFVPFGYVYARTKTEQICRLQT